MIEQSNTGTVHKPTSAEEKYFYLRIKEKPDT